MNRKTTTNALIAAGLLGASSMATAAAYTPPAAPACLPGAVSVACEAEAWDLGVELLWVEQVSGTNWYWSQNRTTSTDNNLSRTQMNDLNPKNAFGFKIEGAYHFGTGSDFSVNWTYFKRSSNDSTNRATSDYINDAPTADKPADRVDGEWDNIANNSKTQFNQVNFEFGQTVDFGEYVDVRFHGGLAYVNLRHEMTVTGTNDEVQGNANWHLNGSQNEMNSRFNGVGPRFGQDLAYNFGNGFSVFGKYAVAAFIGKLKSSSVELDLRANVDPQVAETSASQRAIVAGLETALGVQYAWEMQDRGMLNMYAAWRANTYQGIVQQGDGNNNWGYHGPVIGFKWVGNV